MGNSQIKRTYSAGVCLVLWKKQLVIVRADYSTHEWLSKSGLVSIVETFYYHSAINSLASFSIPRHSLSIKGIVSNDSYTTYLTVVIGWSTLFKPYFYFYVFNTVIRVHSSNLTKKSTDTKKKKKIALFNLDRWQFS